MFFIGESLWLRSTSLKKEILLKKKNNKQENLILQNSLKKKNNSDSFFKQYSYEEMKVALHDNNNIYWETVNYTLPIDYDT
jgi:hypothetical protein